MTVRRIMSEPTGLVDPMATVAAAARLMRDQDLGCLLVGRGDRVVGIVTDRDIVVRAVAAGRNPHHQPVRDVMSSEVLVCFEDQPVGEAARLMAAHGVRRLPVLDRRGSLVGIVSLSDVRGGGSRKKPYAVTFYKELLDSRGMSHEVPLHTVYVAGVDSEEEAAAKAAVIFDRDWRPRRWNDTADGYRVHGAPETKAPGAAPRGCLREAA